VNGALENRIPIRQRPGLKEPFVALERLFGRHGLEIRKTHEAYFGASVWNTNKTKKKTITVFPKFRELANDIYKIASKNPNPDSQI
jgi:hypothetical protein